MPNMAKAYLRRQDPLILDGEHLAQLEGSAPHAAEGIGQPLSVLVSQVGIEAILLGLLCGREEVADLRPMSVSLIVGHKGIALHCSHATATCNAAAVHLSTCTL